MEPSDVLEVDAPAATEPGACRGVRAIETRIMCTVDGCRGVLNLSTLGHYSVAIRNEVMSHLMKGCGGACDPSDWLDEDHNDRLKISMPSFSWAHQ